MTETQPLAVAADQAIAERAPYLVFRLDQSYYAIAVPTVREIVQLPALQPVVDSPAHYAGLVNLRGRIVPVMDLNARLGGPSSQFVLDDRLIVIQSDDQLLALVVNETSGVRQISADQTEPLGPVDGGPESERPFVDRVAKVDDKIVMLLDVARLLNFRGDTSHEGQFVAGSHDDSLLAHLSVEARNEFQDRARRLMQSSAGRRESEQLLVAVVEIGGELFALELEFVREFFQPQRVTPVPCCPKHVIGNVNLRGEIVTIIDVRRALNLPVKPPGTAGNVVVVRIADTFFGVLVDQWHDVVDLPVSDIRGVPAGIQADGYCKGTATHGDKMMSILDIPRLMALETWTVEEDVGRV